MKPQPLPPELAELAGMAAAADTALSGAELAPGAKPAPEVDQAAELADMLTLGVSVLGKVLDPVPKFFPPETCAEIAKAYLACADKHGWTWHEKTGGPEVRLGLAIGVPAFLCAMETRRWLAWKEQQALAPIPRPADASMTAQPLPV